MIQIYIDNKLIDLDNTNISLQKEFSDEVENIPTEIEYSYTVSIPATMNNKEIFGFTDTFDVANKFKRLYNASLYVDEQLILEGKFKVTSIESGYYKGNIYNPKKQTISDILGDRKLSEITPHYKYMNSLSDFDKMNNYVCGLETDTDRLPPNTWEAEVLDNHVVFPYMLYSLPMHNVDNIAIDADIYTQDLEYKKHNINDNNIYPAFNVISVLKDIFKTEGYNLTGNIIDGNMKDFFGGLYQTFQYGYDDYVKNKEVPFFCEISGLYYNWCRDYQNNKYNVSPSLEIMDIWDAPSFISAQGSNHPELEGSFQYGVDNPWTAGYKDDTHMFNGMYIKDDKHMFVKGSADKNTGILVIPRSGWYKINLKGDMVYPFTGDQILNDENDSDVLIGGTTDEADNTDLSEQPFEIQLKKGTPKDNPTFYSFFSFQPMNAVEYHEDVNVAMDNGGRTWLRIPESETQRRYPKNGGAAYVRNIGDFTVDDFICGARLGGAWFSAQWGAAYHGYFQRKNRFFAQGAGLALPNPSKPITRKLFVEESTDDPYKTDEPKFDGWFYSLADVNTNKNYEYAEDTALCIVKDPTLGAYTNFGGYNVLKGSYDDPTGQYSWDTTSNYGKVSWEGAENCTAYTGTITSQDKKHRGRWDVNTVVWLEEGDTLYLELLIPMHTGGHYTCCHSKWVDQHHWVNAVTVNYDLWVGYMNGDKDWKPRVDDGVKSWDYISKPKKTNVNLFLPELKCNDYLEKFLKTFNLQLTMVDSKTFSIDTINGGNLMGNVINIDKICNIDDAEFKPLKSDSIHEYKWKIDQNETGYAQGNQSPHKSSHGESVSTSPYYASGYTGEETLVNDANSSGSIKKNESQWSYNWYKTIHFLHNAIPQPITEEWADISTISETDIWKDGMTFAATSGEKPKTTKTMRLFTLKKNQETRDKAYSYISFKYDESGGENGWNPNVYTHDLLCNLVLPSNYYETYDISGNIHRLHLDYKIMDKTNDGRAYNQSLMDVFFNKNVQGGYDIEVPIKLSNEDYAKTKQGTLYKLNDGLYRCKSIEGHDVNKKDNSTLTLTTLK